MKPYLRPDAVVPARAVMSIAGLAVWGAGRGAVVVGDADHRGVAGLGAVHLAELVSRAAGHGAGAPLARLPAGEGERGAGERGRYRYRLLNRDTFLTLPSLSPFPFSSISFFISPFFFPF